MGNKAAVSWGMVPWEEWTTLYREDGVSWEVCLIEGDGNGKRQLFCRGGYEVGPFNVLAKVASKFCATLPSALRT